MLAAPLPADEPKRLATLLRLKLLDCAPDPSFEAITRCAAAATGAPISLISLVDAKRQWFMCRIGLAATETAREVSFCGHAILEREPLMIVDARQDPRFADNPLVTGPPHVCAYLGVPLVTADDDALGTLCTIDNKPKLWTHTQIAIMRDLACATVGLIQAHAQRLELAAVVEQALAARVA